MVEYVKCSSCKSKFHTNVLTHGPRDLKAALNMAMLKGMIRIMTADGRITREEFYCICKIYEERSGTKNSQAEVLVQMQHMENKDISSDFRRFAKVLDQQEKEQVIAAMVSVCLADGELDRSEAVLVQKVGEILGVELARTKVILKAEYNRRDRAKDAAMARLSTVAKKPQVPPAASRPSD